MTDKKIELATMISNKTGVFKDHPGVWKEIVKALDTIHPNLIDSGEVSVKENELGLVLSWNDNPGRNVPASSIGISLTTDNLLQISEKQPLPGEFIANKFTSWDIKLNENNKSVSVEKVAVVKTKEGVEPHRPAFMIESEGERTVYDAVGVETTYDYVKMKPYEVYQEFGSIDNYFYGTSVTKSCLGAEDYRYRHSIAEKRHMDRISIDIARTISYIDTAPTMNSMEPKEYASYTQLSSDAGLREMHPVPTEDPYPAEVIIPELAPAEIEQLIVQEKNPAVQESLRRWAQGRDQLHYYSKEDQYFKRTGFDERSL